MRDESSHTTKRSDFSDNIVIPTRTRECKQRKPVDIEFGKFWRRKKGKCSICVDGGGGRQGFDTR